MEPDKKQIEEHKVTADPVKQARLDAEEAIAEDPEFRTDPQADDLDEGELAKLDNSNDKD